MSKPVIFRVTTVPISLKTLLKGQHRFMSGQGFEVIGVSSPGPELWDVQHDEGIAVIPVEMTRKISPWHDLISLWTFYRLCKKQRPTIVHSHTPKAGIIGMLGAWLAGVPIRLHTVAGLPLMQATGVKRKLLVAVEKLTYRFATAVYPNSKGLYDYILQHRFTSAKKLKVLANGSSNGIDTRHFAIEQVSAERRQSLRAELGITDKEFVFIFVGRLVGDKGVNELVSAFSQLSRAMGEEVPAGASRPKLLLVGAFEMELDPLLPETLAEIEINSQILSVGFQQDVRPYFAIADVLTFPSYREGFPNVVLQAGAMGLPCIVSDINGCNEIIVEGKNGTMVPVKNTEALLRAMERMLSDNTYYSSLQSHARPMITNRYEQHVVWDAILAEYKSLLQKRREHV